MQSGDEFWSLYLLVWFVWCRVERHPRWSNRWRLARSFPSYHPCIDLKSDQFLEDLHSYISKEQVTWAYCSKLVILVTRSGRIWAESGRIFKDLGRHCWRLLVRLPWWCNVWRKNPRRRSYRLRARPHTSRRSYADSPKNIYKVLPRG